MDGDGIAQLMRSLREGSEQAARELMDAFYPELRRMAAARMKHERPGHTWQPTVLVNELYLELVKLRKLEGRDYTDEEEKAAFFHLAGSMMRRLLIHHARPLYRRVERVELSETAEPQALGLEGLADVEDALSRLAEVDPRFRSVVEMRVFEGLSGEEIAERMGCSRRSVTNYWEFARNWLRKEWAERPRA